MVVDEFGAFPADDDVVVVVAEFPFAVVPPPLLMAACPLLDAIECLSFDVGVLLGVLFCICTVVENNFSQCDKNDISRKK